MKKINKRLGFELVTRHTLFPGQGQRLLSSLSPHTARVSLCTQKPPGKEAKLTLVTTGSQPTNSPGAHTQLEALRHLTI